MPLILGANSLAGGYQIKNSARFNSGSTDYLNKTFSGAGTSDKIGTMSCWIKRSDIASETGIFTAGATSRNFIRFESTGELTCRKLSTWQLTTTQLFRDVSAWYHIVIAIDTTQATSSNRIRFYVNGSEVTAFSTASYPSQNTTINYGQAQSHRIGSDAEQNSPYLSGYLADFFYIDGQQLTPSSFGETDEDSGIWKPKAYTGTFGTNGFYLDFEDSANLGNDMSGNNNDFTVNNLTSIDQTTDTPTNNFATLNPLVPTGGTYTEGNLQYQTATTDGNWSWSSITPSSGGNWYCESKMISSSNGTYQVGITSVTNGSPRILYVSNGAVYVDGSNVATYATYTTNDIIGMAYNSSTKSLTFYKNGTSQGSQTATSSNDYFFGSTGQSGGATHTVAFNFGNPPYSANSYTDANGYGNFSYQVPSGYYSLNSKNLAQYG